MKSNLNLRALKESDCKTISEAFKQQGWNKPVSLYKQYIQYQETGERDIIVAELKDVLAGYLTINWKSGYKPFREKGIPEIVDFNVFKNYQRQGIGTSLMDEAESRIKKVSDYAGIGFGITQDYGAAQILYIKRNYVPDGRGIVKDSVPLKYGENIIVNDDLVFCLTKKL